MTSDDEHDWAVIEAIRARGPVWIPAEEANALMEQIAAEVDEDAAAFREWDALKAAGQATTVPHAEARRQLGLDLE